MAKKETANLERTYNIPLRKEFQKVPCWKRSKKAIRVAKEFLQKHMKSEDVRLSKELNEKIWQHGIKNPPHHVKVNVTKDNEGVVRAELFGAKAETKVEKNPAKKVAKKAAEPEKKEEVKENKKEVAEKIEAKPEVKAETHKEEKPAEEKSN